MRAYISRHNAYNSGSILHTNNVGLTNAYHSMCELLFSHVPLWYVFQLIDRLVGHVEHHIRILENVETGPMSDAANSDINKAKQYIHDVCMAKQVYIVYDMDSNMITRWCITGISVLCKDMCFLCI